MNPITWAKRWLSPQYRQEEIQARYHDYVKGQVQKQRDRRSKAQKQVGERAKALADIAYRMLVLRARQPSPAVPPLDRISLALGLAKESPENAAAMLEVYARLAEGFKAAALYHVVGRILQRTSELDRAEAAYQKSAEIHPTLSHNYVQLGELCATQGRIPEAIQHLKQARAFQHPEQDLETLTQHIVGEIRTRHARYECSATNYFLDGAALIT